jgi:hypothetical protein
LDDLQLNPEEWTKTAALEFERLGAITGPTCRRRHRGALLIFIHEHPPENVAMNGILQSENSTLLKTVRKIASCRSGKCALDFTTRRGCTR